VLSQGACKSQILFRRDRAEDGMRKVAVTLVAAQRGLSMKAAAAGL